MSSSLKCELPKVGSRLFFIIILNYYKNQEKLLEYICHLDAAVVSLTTAARQEVRHTLVAHNINHWSADEKYAEFSLWITALDFSTEFIVKTTEELCRTMPDILFAGLLSFRTLPCEFGQPSDFVSQCTRSKASTHFASPLLKRSDDSEGDSSRPGESSNGFVEWEKVKRRNTFQSIWYDRFMLPSGWSCDRERANCILSSIHARRVYSKRTRPSRISHRTNLRIRALASTNENISMIMVSVFKVCQVLCCPIILRCRFNWCYDYVGDIIFPLWMNSLNCIELFHGALG